MKFLAKASSKNIENKRTLFEFIVATVALKNFTGLSQPQVKITNIEINRFWLTFGHEQMNDNIMLLYYVMIDIKEIYIVGLKQHSRYNNATLYDGH